MKKLESLKMTHWGWYWRVKKKHVSKTLCSDLLCLDSFNMFKRKITDFAVTGDDCETKINLIDVGLKIINKDKTYLVPVEKQPCHFGGFRYFFRCPYKKCQQRMRKLYFYNGYFLCRKCLRLGYYTQSVSPCRRYLWMRDKVESVLINACGGTHNKPKWMRKSTFKVLQDRYWDYHFKHEDAFERKVMTIFGCSVSEAFKVGLSKKKLRQSRSNKST